MKSYSESIKVLATFISFRKKDIDLDRKKFLVDAPSKIVDDVISNLYNYTLIGDINKLSEFVQYDKEAISSKYKQFKDAYDNLLDKNNTKNIKEPKRVLADMKKYADMYRDLPEFMDNIYSKISDFLGYQVDAPEAPSEMIEFLNIYNKIYESMDELNAIYKEKVKKATYDTVVKRYGSIENAVNEYRKMEEQLERESTWKPMTKQYYEFQNLNREVIRLKKMLSSLGVEL